MSDELKPLVVGIIDLARVCGFFNSKTDLNNGYGCDHPDQEETEYDEKAECQQGKCYSFSCPLAVECDLQDLKEHDEYLYRQYKDEEFEPNEMGAELMLVRDQNLIERL